jgi:glutamyl/glutaminyl-tRNA synthetase
LSQPPAYYAKTRIAPTPSGFLHLGNVLSFAITASMAKKNDAKILLRIDDLDRARVNKQFLQDVFDTLDFLEIAWDEGPHDLKDFEKSWSQLHRMDNYRAALQQLADKGLVYACTCSRSKLTKADSCTCFNKQLPLHTENTSWRLLTVDSKTITIKNYGGQLLHAELPGEMHNFIVRKKDGFPAYQLTSVMDDIFYGIDLVVRGEDLWPSTLAQHVLVSALENNRFREVTFYHHPLLMEPSGNKLSKSAGATSVKYLREQGKKAADVYSIIAGMLGFEGTVHNWEQLAGLIYPANG